MDFHLGDDVTFEYLGESYSGTVFRIEAKGYDAPPHYDVTLRGFEDTSFATLTGERGSLVVEHLYLELTDY